MLRRPHLRTSVLLSGTATAVVLLLVSLFHSDTSSAQAQGQATAASIRRMPDGKPDLQGIWQVLSPASWDLEDHPASPGVPAGLGVVVDGQIPYQPQALVKKKENFAGRRTADPVVGQCYLPGVPRFTYLPFPFQIVQTPKQVVMLSEYAHASRTIYLDSMHPYEKDVEFWMGDSRGRWEGDSLVIDVTNFTGETWLDHAGNYHSAALHVVERYTPMGPDHLAYEATLEDPTVFTRPWTIRLPLYRRLERNLQILDYECYGWDYLEQRQKYLEGFRPPA